MAFAITASGWARILLSSFVTGIALASFIPGKILLPLAVGVFVLLSFVVVHKKFHEVLFFVVAVSFLLGIFRYQVAVPDRGEGSVASWLGQEVVLEGVVSDEVSRSSKTQGLVLDELLVNGESLEHRVLARVPLYPEFRYGDRVRLGCVLEEPEPFEGFRYDRYLAKDGVLALCQSYREPFSFGRESVGLRGGLLDFKQCLLELIRRLFHEPQASLLEGLLLGEKNLPESIEEDFRRVGLSHIIAASGQNVSLVASVLFWFLIALGFYRRGASIAVLFGILSYVILAGADAAVIRAGIMGSVIVFARAAGRIPSTVNLLLLALTLMLLHNPLLLRDDVGFQLSFVATAGLVVLQPRLSRFFFFLPTTLGIREAMATSVAAIAATLPIIILSFGNISFVAPVANMLVLPLIPVVMIGGGIILFLSLFSSAAATVLSAPVVGGLEMMLGAAHLLSQLPFAAVDIVRWSWLRFLLFLLVLLLLRLFVTLKPWQVDAGYGFTKRSLLVLLLFLSLPILPDLIPNQVLRAHFFSVGQGDATMLKLPSGERWLIDGGPDDTVLTKIGQILPWHERTIDVLVVTHADADHVTGLIELSRRYHVSRVYLSSEDASLKMQMLENLWKDVPMEIVSAGTNLSRGGVKVEVLSPSSELVLDDRNDLSMILLMEYENQTMLLTGDASQDREREILSELGSVDVLKVGHHGSYTSTSYELLQKTRPGIAIISSGADNRYRHPHGVVLERLRQVGSQIFRTDQQGDIEIAIDGGELDVQVGKFWY